MPRWPLLLAGALAALALGATMSQCSGAPEDHASDAAPHFDAQETAQLLPGTWLREYSEQGVQVRRVLVLEPQGAFHEAARVVEAEGKETRVAHEGTWLFDGTNLKRRYTLMNGVPPSRLTVPFATFEIVFESRNEFTGIDHVHGHRIRYQRVEPGTTP